MRITSPQFTEQELIPTQYTCKGKNVNPSLIINDIPENTVSLALIMHDPDSIYGDFLHWVVWNIPPETTMINENSVPNDAVSGMNGKKKNAYMGPCPPANTGTHHYMFELYALDAMLDLSDDAARSAIENAITAHTIEQATLIGLFSKELQEESAS